ncbi:serine/threonine protein phosphatase [Macrococcus epidermidis]|uniref:Serine/threonine protein phosphatase n=1 Tax=Macrococcus epidermidis TaxID=1902580 RepID=A0A327ZUG1_9STAP|nr:metallophosphoesterase family protein [Macrococcus epidermidis]RAK45941.1 serine/threonine protein phosphatase [Macrococcus epidermidis]
MSKLYAISDIHGHYQEFLEALDKIDLSVPDNKLLLLGDYIDNGSQSLEVIEKIISLEQEYPNQIITLLGNHDELLIDWLFKFEPCLIDEQSLLSFFGKLDDSVLINGDLKKVFIEKYPLITNWLKRKNNEKRYYETDNQIFVHAGIWETKEDQEYWKSYTCENLYTHKYPAETGRFYKDIIAGHIYAHEIANNKEYLGRIYHDNESHYYIDGDVQKSGYLPILVYDTEKKLYTFIEKENY